MRRVMAYSLAIVFTLVIFAHLGSSLMLIDGWEGKVCAAYFKASGLDKSMYPAGQCWSDKVCVDDPSFYLVCELNNGVFTGEKRQCPPGKQFYHGANQMWEKTCVPADKCKTNKQCPNWLGQPTPVKTECQRQRESALGLGGFAPSCDINGDFDPLQCGVGFCWCVYADGTKIANTKCDMASSLTKAQCALFRLKAPTPVYEGFKPLQCGAGFCWCVYADGTKIPNTKFVMGLSTLTDAKCALFREKVPTPIYEGVKPLQCAAGFCWCVYADGTKIPSTKCETAFSSLTDAKCALLRNEAPYQGVKPLQCGVGFCWCVYADGTKIPGTKFAMALSALTDSKCALYREKVPTPVNTPVIVGVTKRQCACKMALKLSTSGSSSAYACDPYLKHNFLVCQDDGTFESKPCPVVGQSWNYMEKTCSDKMRKCRPLPATCL